jgi:hypothetical protein
MTIELILDNPKYIDMKHVPLDEVCFPVPQMLSVFIPEELIHENDLLSN